MPLIEGSSDDILRENISELRRSGYPEDQALAIALKKQREAVARERGESDPKEPSPLAAAAAAAHEQSETPAAEGGEQTMFSKQGAGESVLAAAASGAPKRKDEPTSPKKKSSDEIPMKVAPRKKQQSGTYTSSKP